MRQPCQGARVRCCDVDSGISFDDAALKVVVTGTLGHAASEDCRPAYEAWAWSPPDSWAQNRCMRLFVITDVRARS